MSNADEIIDRLVDDPDVPATRDEIEAQVDETAEEMAGNQKTGMSDEDLRYYAARVVKSELKFESRSGFGGGESEELPILALGYQDREEGYWVTDGDGLHAGGIVNPENDPAGFAVFVIDSAHGIDIDHAKHCFSPLTTVRGNLARSQVGSRDGTPTIKKGGAPVYVVNTTANSTLEVVDPDEADGNDPISDLPAGREEKRALVNENFITEEDELTVKTYADHVSPTNERGYAVAMGADVKRIRGEVIDAVVFDSGNGLMTITDDSIYSEDDVPEDLVSDQMRTPGLQVSISGDLILGERSIVDVYGYIEQRDDGQYRMGALGIIPHFEYEYSGPAPSGSDDDFEEDTI